MTKTGDLGLCSVLGFSGDVVDGLICHPDGVHVIYPLGSTVIVRRRDDPSDQKFLRGHTDKITTIALSRSGKYLATGQVTHMGFKAPIILWDLETLEIAHKMVLHKVQVKSLDFSPDDEETGQPRFLASLGGPDDNALVLWDVETGQAMCGSPTSNDFTNGVRFFNNSADKLITCGNYNLSVWEYDAAHNKLRKEPVNLGNLSRVFNTVTVDANDEFAYAGSASGDIMKIALDRKLLRAQGPHKGLIELGVTCLAMAPEGMVLVGGGNGVLSLVTSETVGAGKSPKVPVVGATKVGDGAITSMSVDWNSWDGTHCTLFLGLNNADMYRAVLKAGHGIVATEIVQTAHTGKINALAFPYEYSDVFATAAAGEIRVWHLDTCRELLRIEVPNLECNAVCFTDDGKLIISGWSDGKIRAFGPQTGRSVWSITDAHPKGVSAVACTSDSKYVISGGRDGAVRVWSLGPESQTLIASMKEHKGAVNRIAVRYSADDECVTAAADGTCVVWDLTTMKRRLALQSNCDFKSVCYHPDDSQLVTVGSDRKITYWDTFDGQPIRVLDGSENHGMTSVATDGQGTLMVVGAEDKQVKIFKYDEGIMTHVGTGHSGVVKQVLVAPDRTRIVSVGSDGGILIWDAPQE